MLNIRLTEYLSKLLNRKIGPSENLLLTSGQRARLYSWLQSNGYSIHPQKISRIITISSLLSNIEELNKPILEKYDDGWWLVECEGEQGLIPSNYAREYDENEDCCCEGCC